MLRDLPVKSSSDQGTHSSKDGRPSAHSDDETSLVLHSDHFGVIEVRVLLVLIVHQIGSEALNGVVDSVDASVSAHPLHEVLGPVLVAMASVGMEFVVFNDLESLL